MSEEFYDLPGQQERASQLRRLLIQNHLKDISPEGRPIGKKWLIGGGEPDLGGRSEWFYLCQGLWNESDSYGALTEAIDPYFTPLEGFGTFEPCFCMLELTRNKTALTANQVKKFEDYAQRYMHLYMHPDSDLIGVNDNTPLLMIAGLILGGEYFGRDEWKKEGRERLLRTKRLLARRGFLSEYNSLTYTPLSIYGLAIIVNFARCEECRALALELEIELWKHVAAMYQPSVCQTAGPYARAYPQDKLAHSYQMRTLLYILLGDKCGVSPINTIFAGDPDENYYWQISAAHIGSMLYHCPKAIAEGMLKKPYPYLVRGTAEFSASADSHMLTPPLGDGYASEENLLRSDFEKLDEQDSTEEYSAGVLSLYSYQDEDYSIGTATHEWHNGAQTDSFTVLYSKKGTAHSQEEVGTVFANYGVNGSDCLGNDMGRKIAMQHERTAMVLYRPKWCGEEVSEAGLHIVFGNGALVNKMQVGERRLEGEALQAEGTHYTGRELTPVFVHMGHLYLMLIPLVAEKDREKASLELKNDGGNLLVTIYNDKGSKTRYHKKGFCLLTNGFVCELRKQEEYKSFEDFIEKMQDFRICEQIRRNIHTRYAVEREIRYEGEGAALECCISMLTDGVKYMTVNDELFEEVKFFAGGVTADEN